MLRGLWRLTWLELKIFVREPMGRDWHRRCSGAAVRGNQPAARATGARGVARRSAFRFGRPSDLHVLLIAASAVQSLAAIMAIYREGGILKRLRATPLRPSTILTAHVLVKLLLTAVTLGFMVLVGRRYYPVGADVPLLSFTVALLFSTVSLLSLGFVFASIVPTARFAQPIGSLILYPMIGLSGCSRLSTPSRPCCRQSPASFQRRARSRCSGASGTARV